MEKTRTLGLNLGEYGDKLYRGYSIGVWANQISGNPEALLAKNDLLEAYHRSAALRATEMNVPDAYTGQEFFTSSERPYPMWNDCTHIKDRYVNLPYGIFWPRYQDDLYYYVEPYYRLSPLTGTTPWDGTKASFGDFESAKRRAWWAMQPRFEGDISMLNFIFELKDFRDIVKSFMRMRSPSLLAKEMRSHQARLRRISAKLTPKSRSLSSMTSSVVKGGMTTAEILAQLHLINEFAIKPTINDVGSILSQIGVVVREAQAEFLRRGQEAQVSHYSESITHCDSLTPASKYVYWYGTGTYHKTTFTATLEYKYNYLLRSQTDAFLRYWGLKFTPEVIWNAIPFSFLADYFAKIGNAIHFMSTDPNTTLMSTRYCESLLCEYVSGKATIGDPRPNLCVNGVISEPKRGVPITGHTGSFYQRRLTSPNKGSATPRFSLPTGKQGANMAALAMCFLK